jgi:hypothetical protein
VARIEGFDDERGPEGERVVGQHGFVRVPPEVARGVDDVRAGGDRRGIELAEDARGKRVDDERARRDVLQHRGEGGPDPGGSTAPGEVRGQGHHGRIADGAVEAGAPAVLMMVTGSVVPNVCSRAGPGVSPGRPGRVDRDHVIGAAGSTAEPARRRGGRGPGSGPVWSSRARGTARLPPGGEAGGDALPWRRAGRDRQGCMRCARSSTAGTAGGREHVPVLTVDHEVGEAIASEVSNGTSNAPASSATFGGRRSEEGATRSGYRCSNSKRSRNGRCVTASPAAAAAVPPSPTVPRARPRRHRRGEQVGVGIAHQQEVQRCGGLPGRLEQETCALLAFSCPTIAEHGIPARRAQPAAGAPLGRSVAGRTTRSGRCRS